MASVLLPKADLALFSDLTKRTVIPFLMSSAPERSYAGVGVRFAGDAFATPFRGEGRTKSWNLTCRYIKTDQARLLELLDLIELAANSPDSRLFLRTHYGQVPGLNEAIAVQILNIQPVPQVGLYYDVSFTAQAVNFTLAV